MNLDICQFVFYIIFMHEFKFDILLNIQSTNKTKILHITYHIWQFDWLHDWFSGRLRQLGYLLLGEMSAEFVSELELS